MMQREISLYNKHYSQVKNLLPKSIVENFHMHDCILLSSGFNGNNFVLTMDSSKGFTPITKLIFTDAEILENDIAEADSEKLWWLYDEIYIVENKYELHILFANEQLEPKQMIIVADDILLS